MGLDVRIVMAKNLKQIKNDNFWSTCFSGWKQDQETGIILYDEPCEVCYWRNFWSLYSPVARKLKLENGEYGMLTKDDIEDILYILLKIL